MPALLSSLLKTFIIFIIFTGCQTNPVYSIKTISDPADPSNKSFDLQVIHVNSNRIKQECYFVNAESDQNWRHQYFLYILKDNNTVMTLMHPFNQDDDQCNEQLTKIANILKVNSSVKICARDELKVDTESVESKIKHDFKNLGSYPESGEILTLDRICGSKSCFSNSKIWTTTCPQ